MTVTWIDDSWELHDVLLDFVEVEGTHSGENLAKHMLQSLIELDLVEMVSAQYTKIHHIYAYHIPQFITVTADNMSNNTTLLDNIVKSIKTSQDTAIAKSDDALVDKLSELDPQRSMIHCLPHVIHLAVMALLDSLDAVSEKDAAPVGDVDEFDLMTEDEAERIGVPPGANNNVIVDDCNDEVDMSSVIAKVRKDFESVECDVTKFVSQRFARSPNSPVQHPRGLQSTKMLLATSGTAFHRRIRMENRTLMLRF